MTESCIHKQNSKHHLKEVKREKWSYNSQFNRKVQMEEKQAIRREYTKVSQVVLSINSAEKLSINYLIFFFLQQGNPLETRGVTNNLGSSLYLKADGLGSGGPTGLVSVSLNQKMFHSAAETSLF